MKTMFAFLAIILLLPIVSWAEGGIAPDNVVPQQMERSSSPNSKGSVWNLVGYTTYRFRSFSLGKANNLPEAELKRLLGVVAGAKEDQVIFVQGVSDKKRWRDRVNENHNFLDSTLAMDRAHWVIEKVKEHIPGISGKIKSLSPSSKRDGRGVNVYIAEYERKDSLPSSLDVQVGGTVGSSFVSAGRMNFFVPTAGLILKSGPWEVSFFGGWRPANKNEDGLGDRAQSIVGAELILRDGEWFGYSAGFNTAWETLQDHSYKYVDRITGFYSGPKLFASYNGFSFVAGGNVQVVSLNRFGKDKSWWKTGYGLNLQLQRLFN